MQDYEDYEVAYNTQPAGGMPTGILTVDGVHPCEVTSGTYPFCPVYTHADYMIANAFAKSLIATVAGRV